MLAMCSLTTEAASVAIACPLPRRCSQDDSAEFRASGKRPYIARLRLQTEPLDVSAALVIYRFHSSLSYPRLCNSREVTPCVNTRFVSALNHVLSAFARFQAVVEDDADINLVAVRIF